MTVSARTPVSKHLRTRLALRRLTYLHCLFATDPFTPIIINIRCSLLMFYLLILTYNAVLLTQSQFSKDDLEHSPFLHVQHAGTRAWFNSATLPISTTLLQSSENQNPPQEQSIAAPTHRSANRIPPPVSSTPSPAFKPYVQS